MNRVWVLCIELKASISSITNTMWVRILANWLRYSMISYKTS
jgi:hypothetical protein